jgi:hypothetical protein
MSSGEFDELVNGVAKIIELSGKFRARSFSFTANLLRFLTTSTTYAGLLDKCERSRDLRASVACLEELAKAEADMISALESMLEVLNEDYNTLKELIDAYKRIQPMLEK